MGNQKCFIYIAYVSIAATFCELVPEGFAVTVINKVAFRSQKFCLGNFEFCSALLKLSSI